MFNPNSWLQRSRVHSHGSTDFSTSDSLVGLSFANELSPLDKRKSMGVSSSANGNTNSNSNSNTGSGGTNSTSTSSNSNRRGTTGYNSNPPPKLRHLHTDARTKSDVESCTENGDSDGYDNSNHNIDSNDGDSHYGRNNTSSNGNKLLRQWKYLENGYHDDAISLQNEVASVTSPGKYGSRKSLHLRHSSMPISLMQSGRSSSRYNHDDTRESRNSYVEDLDADLSTDLEDTFQADIDAHEFAVEVSSPNRNKMTDRYPVPLTRPRPHSPNQSIHRNSSFGNHSCISDLSTDETNCFSFDESKTTKSLDAGILDRQQQPYLQRPHHRSRSGHSSRGRDFGAVFDHLIEDDLHRPPRDEAHVYRTNNRGFADPDLRRPKPMHQRAQSDTMAFRRPTAAPQYQYTLKELPAHATVRERITSNMLSSKPQLLQARSTSNTVQSGASSSSASTYNHGHGHGGKVWNGQPTFDQQYNHHHDPATHRECASPHRIVRDGGAKGISQLSVCSGDKGDRRHYRHHSDIVGSRAMRVYTQNKYHPSGATPRTFNETDDEDKSLKDVPEEVEHGGNGSKSVDGGQSVLSGTSTSSRRKKHVIKDELKFMLGKMVPNTLKKHIQSKRNQVNLERSEGCLT